MYVYKNIYIYIYMYIYMPVPLSREGGGAAVSRGILYYLVFFSGLRTLGLGFRVLGLRVLRFGQMGKDTQARARQQPTEDLQARSPPPPRRQRRRRSLQLPFSDPDDVTPPRTPWYRLQDFQLRCRTTTTTTTSCSRTQTLVLLLRWPSVATL